MRGPAILLTEGVQILRLDGLLTLIAITHGNSGGLMNLTGYPEHMREKVRKFDVKRSTDSWKKIRDFRHTLIQYLLRKIALEQERMKRFRGRTTCEVMLGGMPLLNDLSLAMRTDPLALIRGASSHVCVP